jgi:hypothetical protein
MFPSFVERWADPASAAPLCPASMVRHMASFASEAKSDVDAELWPPLPARTPPATSLTPRSLLSVTDHVRFRELQRDGLSERESAERAELVKRVRREQKRYHTCMRDRASQLAERYRIVHREAGLLVRGAVTAAQQRCAQLPGRYTLFRTYAREAAPAAAARNARVPPPRLVVAHHETRGSVAPGRLPSCPAQLDLHSSDAGGAASRCAPLVAQSGELHDAFARTCARTHGAGVVMSEAAFIALLDDGGDGGGGDGEGSSDLVLELSVRGSDVGDGERRLLFSDPIPPPIAETPARAHNSRLFERRFEELCARTAGEEGGGAIGAGGARAKVLDGAFLYSVLALTDERGRSARVLVRCPLRIDCRCASVAAPAAPFDHRRGIRLRTVAKVEHLAEHGAERFGERERCRWWGAASARGCAGVAVARVRCTDGAVDAVEVVDVAALDSPASGLRAAERVARLASLLRRMGELPLGRYVLRRRRGADAVACFAAAPEGSASGEGGADGVSAEEGDGATFDLHAHSAALLESGGRVCCTEWERSYRPLRWTQGGGAEAGGEGCDVLFVEDTLPPLLRHHCQMYASFGFCDNLRHGTCAHVHVRGPFRVQQKAAPAPRRGAAGSAKGGGVYDRLFHVQWPARERAERRRGTNPTKRARRSASASAAAPNEPVDAVFIKCPPACRYCWAHEEGRFCPEVEAHGKCSYPHLSRAELLEAVARHVEENGVEGVLAEVLESSATLSVLKK